MRRMAGLDAAFLYAESTSWQMHTAAMIVLDPSTSPTGYDFEHFKAHSMARYRLLPQFRWKPVEVPFGLDRPGWVEEEHLDPDLHIRRVAVPAPGGQRELAELAGRLHSYPLDRRRPLWELWVIEGVERGRVAVLAKTHHAIVDGVSGVGLTDVVYDREPDPPPRRFTAREVVAVRAPSRLALVATGLANLVGPTPARAVRFGAQTIRQGRVTLGFIGRAGLPLITLRAPRSALNGELTPDRSMAWTSLSLPQVKAVKNTFGVKLNDVVLDLCASALRRYLLKADQLPPNPLVAECPVSLRSAADRDDVGNKVASIYASLATDVADPVARLDVIARGTAGAKDLYRAVSAHRVMGITDAAPPGLVGLAARIYRGARLDRTLPPPVNLVVSDVPGPPFPLYWAGARVVAQYPMGPLVFGMGLNITVLSYCDSLDFGFLCCPQIVPQPELIAEGVGLALTELEEAAAAHAANLTPVATR